MDIQKSHFCGQAGDKRNMRALFSSYGQERSIAERLSKLSSVEISCKHVLIHNYLHS